MFPKRTLSNVHEDQKKMTLASQLGRRQIAPDLASCVIEAVISSTMTPKGGKICDKLALIA